MKWLFVTLVVITVCCLIFGADGVASVIIAIGKLIKKIKFKGII